MIKVCHIINHITGKSDGVYAHFKMILRYTDKNKFQHYLIFQGGEKVEREMAEFGINVLVCKSLKKKFSLKAFSEIYSFIKQNDISIIHSHLIKPYSIAGLVNILLKKKHLFNYHGLFIYKNIYNGWVEKIVYGFMHFIICKLKAVDAALVPSAKSKELLISETELFPQIIIYYNGYDSYSAPGEMNFDLFEFLNKLKKEKLLIAMAGRLNYEKQIDKGIEIFEKILLHCSNIHLIIFGDGKLKEELEDLIKNLNLTGNVSLLGYVDGVSRYFPLIDILLFTSEREGMPITMWEALAHKIPVIAPDVGGFKEILEENNCGIIFEIGNLNDARLKLQMLIEDAALRNRLGENGVKVINQKYNEENFKNQIENIYTNL